MSRHRATGSDHISKITADAGFAHWQTVWEASASLHARRHNPNLLFKGDRDHPGDEVEVPAAGSREVSAGSGRRHRFVLRSDQLFLRLRVLKADFTAVAGAPYTLTVDGAAAAFTGTTDGSGQIEVEIPRTAQRGELTVRLAAADTDPAGAPPPAGSEVRGPVPVTWPLQIGALDPILELAPDDYCVAGVQQRLNNLGFQSGPVDGVLGDTTKAAVRAFQQAFSLRVRHPGWPGQTRTQPRLRDLHDQPDSVLGPVAAPAPAPRGGGAP